MVLPPPGSAQTHRNIEWVTLEGMLQIILSQAPCHGQRHHPLDGNAHSPIQPGL